MKEQSRLRETIQFYLLDTQTALGRTIDVCIILLNLVICVLYVAQTYPLPPELSTLLWRVEEVIIVVFVVEYAARLYGARQRLRHIFNPYNIIDLVAILPTLSEMILPLFGLSFNIAFIRTLRVIRVFRIFRFLRFVADGDFFFGRINLSILRIMRLGLTILMIFFVSSGLFFHVESPINNQINTYGDAFYYTVVTLTTVGFGDITPISTAGRWVTVLMILSGIVLIPWQASQVVREWIHLSQKRQVVCSNCGLKYHDADASHCKSCGHVIYQEYDGD
jgi:voltage-gated potassium channel